MGEPATGRSRYILSDFFAANMRELPDGGSKEIIEMWSAVRGWARAVKRDVIALYLAARDPRISWVVKLAAAGVAAYALSPIDLIPDFIPILGYLDEVILLPLAIALIVKLIPPELMAEFRAKADDISDRPVSRPAAVAIVMIWLVAAAALVWAFWPTDLG